MCVDSTLVVGCLCSARSIEKLHFLLNLPEGADTTTTAATTTAVTAATTTAATTTAAPPTTATAATIATERRLSFCRVASDMAVSQDVVYKKSSLIE